ncbi:MAG: Acg family FMN-binding oxidoreductase [Actinomycetes bacterium]
MTPLTRHEWDVLLRAAAAAPSLHNSQPWRFEAAGDAVKLYGDPSRRLEHADPDARQLHMSCGAALFNLRVAARRLGYEAAVSLLPDLGQPTLLARVVLNRATGPGHFEAELYAAIPRRRTNRRPFAHRPVHSSELRLLSDAAQAEGATLTTVDEEELSRLTGLVHEAELMDATDPERRVESGAWIGTAPTRRDGVPMSAVGPVPTNVDAVFRDLASRRATPTRERAEFESQPTLAVLYTDGDWPRHWLRAGQALEHIWLLATVHGIAISFLNQPLEYPDLRGLVRDPRTRIGHPQMLLRMGYGAPVPATPRRPLGDVAPGHSDATEQTGDESSGQVRDEGPSR